MSLFLSFANRVGLYCTADGQKMQPFPGHFPSQAHIHVCITGGAGRAVSDPGPESAAPLQRKEERKMQFHPEGHLIDTFENRAALQTPASLAEAMRDGKILEAKAMMCDSKHNSDCGLEIYAGAHPPGGRGDRALRMAVCGISPSFPG